MTKTDANVPEDVLQTIVAKKRASQAEELANQVTLERVEEALANKDWGLLNSMFQRDDNLIVAYWHGSEAEYEANVERVRALHQKIVTHVRTALDTEGVTTPLKSFVGTFFNKSKVYPEDLDVLLDSRFEADGTPLYISFATLEDHTLEQLQDSFRTALRHSSGVASIADRVAHDAMKSMRNFGDDKTVGLAALWECFDDVVGSRSDYLTMSVIDECADTLRVTITQDQFQAMLRQGLNASVHLALHQALYVPKIEDFFEALAHVDAPQIHVSTVKRTQGSFTFDSSDNAAEQIAKYIGIDVDDATIIEAVNLYTQGDKSPRKARAIAELVERRIASGDPSLEQLVLASQNDDIIAAVINRGYVRHSADHIDDFVRQGFGMSTRILSRQGVMVSEPQMSRILDLAQADGGEEWKLAACEQVEHGFIPQTVDVLERLCAMDKYLLPKIEKNITQKGIDLGVVAR